MHRHSRDPAPAELAALGYDFYPHHQFSIEGMGWPVLDTLTELVLKRGPRSRKASRRDGNTEQGLARLLGGNWTKPQVPSRHEARRQPRPAGAGVVGA